MSTHVVEQFFGQDGQNLPDNTAELKDIINNCLICIGTQSDIIANYTAEIGRRKSAEQHLDSLRIGYTTLFEILELEDEIVELVKTALLEANVSPMAVAAIIDSMIKSKVTGNEDLYPQEGTGQHIYMYSEDDYDPEHDADVTPDFDDDEDDDDDDNEF